MLRVARCGVYSCLLHRALGMAVVGMAACRMHAACVLPHARYALQSASAAPRTYVAVHCRRACCAMHGARDCGTHAAHIPASRTVRRMAKAGCFLRPSPSSCAPHVCVQGFFGVVLYLWGGNAMFESVTISKPEMTSFVRECGGRSGGSRIGRRCAAEGCADAAA